MSRVNRFGIWGGNVLKSLYVQVWDIFKLVLGVCLVTVFEYEIGKFRLKFILRFFWDFCFYSNVFDDWVCVEGKILN